MERIARQGSGAIPDEETDEEIRRILELSRQIK